MWTVSAWAGAVSTTAETVEQTAATVSAPMRAVLLLGKGIPPGTYMSAGTRVERVVVARPVCGSVTRVEAGETGASLNFYARQSRVWEGELSRME
ncbi:hypothetical protein GCM10010317_037540 [Streptomyces mirabilis]|nr:hypothetical protein GCM10010317_037540 [Streptomyces mirabilis]